MFGVGCPKRNARPALSNKKANTTQKELNEVPTFQKGKKIKGLPFRKESKRRAWPPKRKGHEACPPKGRRTGGRPIKKEGDWPALQKGRQTATNAKGKERACLQKGRKSRNALRKGRQTKSPPIEKENESPLEGKGRASPSTLCTTT